MVGHIRFAQLPRDAIESVVFLALLGGEDGVSRDLVLGSDDGVRRVLHSLQSSSRLLRDAVSVRAFARRCLSSPSIMESMLLARRRVALHRFLKWRLPDYRIERDLGGAYYLFVRGMVGEQPGRGCFFDAPEPSVIEALDALLDPQGRQQ